MNTEPYARALAFVAPAVGVAFVVGSLALSPADPVGAAIWGAATGLLAENARRVWAGRVRRPRPEDYTCESWRQSDEV